MGLGDRPKTQPTDMCGPQHGSEETVGGGRPHYWVSTCIEPPPCNRGMCPDVGVVHICGQQTPTPDAYIPEDPDGGVCGAISKRSSARETCILEQQGGYMWRWCKRCSFLGPRCGS